MAKNFGKVSTADVECAVNLMGEWLDVKNGVKTPEQVSYTPPPKKIKASVEKVS